MCELLFKGLSSASSCLKVILLVLLTCNIGATIYMIVTISGDHQKVLPFIGIDKTYSSKNEEVADMKEAIYKGIYEEMIFFLVLEFLGLFSVLFNKSTPILMFAMAYLIPNLRYAINLGFAAEIKTTFLAFHALKIICALGSFLFGWAVSNDGKSSTSSGGASVVSSTGGQTSKAVSSVSTAL